MNLVLRRDFAFLYDFLSCGLRLAKYPNAFSVKLTCSALAFILSANCGFFCISFGRYTEKIACSSLRKSVNAFESFNFPENGLSLFRALVKFGGMSSSSSSSLSLSGSVLMFLFLLDIFCLLMDFNKSSISSSSESSIGGGSGVTFLRRFSRR